MAASSRTRFWLLGTLLLLQVADFALTWALVSGRVHQDVYEANPLANAILARGGWVGLGAFKFACAALALGTVLLVWQRRPGTGARLTAGLSLAMLTVVGYSVALLARTDSGQPGDLAPIAERGARIDNEHRAFTAFRSRRLDLCRDLLHGRLDLAGAAGRMARLLAEYRDQFNPRFSAALPNHACEVSVAAYLCQHCDRLAAVDRTLVPLVKRLRQQQAIPLAGAADPRL
jgi:hypothetical protein